MSETGVAVIRARLKLPDTEAFIRAFAPRINASGMLVRTKQVKPIGAKIRFEFSLESGQRMLLGEGVVRKIRGGDNPGMTIRFTRLNQASKELIDRIVAFKEQQRLLNERDPEAEIPIPAPESEDIIEPESVPVPIPMPEPVAAPRPFAPPEPAPLPFAPPEPATFTPPEPALPATPEGAGQLLQPGAVLSALESVEESIQPSLDQGPEEGGLFSMDLDEAELDDVLGNLFGGGDDHDGDGMDALFAPPAPEPEAAAIPTPTNNPRWEEGVDAMAQQEEDPSLDAIPLPEPAPAPAAEPSQDLSLHILDGSEDEVVQAPPSLEPRVEAQDDPYSDAFGALLADQGGEEPEDEAQIALHEPEAPTPAQEETYADAYGALLAQEGEEEHEDSLAGAAEPIASEVQEPMEDPYSDAFGALLADAQEPAQEEEGEGEPYEDEDEDDIALALEDEEEPQEEAYSDAFGALLAQPEEEPAQEPAVDVFSLMTDSMEEEPAQEPEPAAPALSLMEEPAPEQDALDLEEEAPLDLEEEAPLDLEEEAPLDLEEEDPQEEALDLFGDHAASSFYEENPEPPREAPQGFDDDVMSGSGEVQAVARISLSRIPSSEMPALSRQEAFGEDDADSLADAIVAASQDRESPESMDHSPIWPAEAGSEDILAAPPLDTASSFEMFNEVDEDEDEEEARRDDSLGIDIDLEEEQELPAPQLEPLRSLQRDAGPTLSAMPSQEIVAPVEAPAAIRQPLSGELGGLLDELQGREGEAHEVEGGAEGLRLASAVLPAIPVPEPAPVLNDEDDPSLEGLVNLARQEMGASPQEEAQAPMDDILDGVLGELPPPPPPRPSGALPGMAPVQPIQAADPAEDKKKKGGFFSRLFGRD